jgi:hypothetical protein
LGKILQKEQFDQAYKYAKGPAQKEKVWVKRSEHLFEKEQWTGSNILC